MHTLRQGVLAMITRAMVAIARFVLIVLAYACLPLYGLWCAGGAIADRVERRRHSK
jgi:cytochrome c oxidase assembly protein Cox11